jgi:hypothetical protein
LIGGVVEDDDKLEIRVAGILDVMAEALRHVADIEGAELVRAGAAA